MHFSKCLKVRAREDYQRIVGNMKSRWRRRDTSPVVATWLLAAVRGERPILESEGRLRTDQVVRRAFERQESVGWQHLACGRAVRGMVEIQEDWQERKESNQTQ